MFVRLFDEQSYYEMLGISPHAPLGEIAAAYARAVARYRSDSLALYSLFEKDQLDAVRHAIESAYQTLRDEQARREYDRSLVDSGRLSENDIRPDAAPEPPTPTMPEPAPPAASLRISDFGLRNEEKTASSTNPQSLPAVGGQVPNPQSAIRNPKSEDLPSANPQSEIHNPKSEDPPSANPQSEIRNPQLEPPPMRLDGPGLKALRESRGVALAAIAKETKISLSTLEALEANRYSVLPAKVYLKGFLREYARIVGLDPEKVCEEYLRRIGK